MMFGDMQQLPPIPASTALFIPPSAKSTITANEMLNMFWGKSVDALNFYKELEIQQRTADPWYRCFLTECRAGNLSDEMYNYLMGLPTRHCGSWIPGDVSDDDNDANLPRCGDSRCQRLPKVWASYIQKGCSWEEILQEQPECEVCQQQRTQRARLVTANDPRILQKPFLEAPYLHQFNCPRYHAMLLRAVEWAKRGSDRPKQILWMQAQDEPANPKDLGRTDLEINRELNRFLQRHDQDTAGIPGLTPLCQAGWCVKRKLI